MKKLALGVGAAALLTLALSQYRNDLGSTAHPVDSLHPSASQPKARSAAMPPAFTGPAEGKTELTASNVRLKPETRERLQQFSQLMRRALLSDAEQSHYQAMLTSPAILEEIKAVLTAGPLPEDKQKDTRSQEAELLGRLSGIEITHGQVARVRAVNFIKESYAVNASNFDYQAYVKSILFAPDLKEEAEMNVKQSMIAAKIELYRFFSVKIPDLDRYLEEGIENPYQRKIFELLVKKPEKG
jgi:hypothetical protein